MDDHVRRETDSHDTVYPYGHNIFLSHSLSYIIVFILYIRPIMVGCKKKIYMIIYMSKYIIFLDYWQISLFLILQYYVVRLCTILEVCSANFRYFSFAYTNLDIFCVANDVLSNIVSLIGYVDIKWDIYLNFKYCTTNVLRIRKPEITASKIKLMVLIFE